jgi:hypothetical protein
MLHKLLGSSKIGRIRDGIITGGDMAGKDKLYGGCGNDQLTRGPDADHFNYGPGTDTIIDFSPAQGDTKRGNCENF